MGPDTFSLTAICADRHMLGLSYIVIQGPSDQTLQIDLGASELDSVMSMPDTLKGTIEVPRGRYRLNVVWSEVHSFPPYAVTISTDTSHVNIPATPRTFRCPP